MYGMLYSIKSFVARMSPSESYPQNRRSILEIINHLNHDQLDQSINND